MGPAVGGLDTAGRHAPMKNAAITIASKVNPFLYIIALLLDVAGRSCPGITYPKMAMSINRFCGVCGLAAHTTKSELLEFSDSS